MEEKEILNTSFTIITPTIGKEFLINLINSILRQEVGFIGYIHHILLWDDKREKDTKFSPTYDFNCKNENKNIIYNCENISIKGEFCNKNAPGSALRALGLMAASSKFVTFADDDILWDKNHLKNMFAAIENKNWCFSKRRIWTKLPDDQYECLGIDEFESVGEDAKTPYKMVDNNCVMFKREFGVSAAPLYRNTLSYDDDRLFYQFLKQYAGDPGKTNTASVNQVCPNKLIDFFRHNCTKLNGQYNNN